MGRIGLLLVLLLFLPGNARTEGRLLDLGKQRVTRKELVALLEDAPDVSQVTLFHAHMSLAEMEDVMNAFPQVHFDFTVPLGKYRVRTDATAFSTLRNPDEKPRYGSEDYAPIAYCMSLMALDLGHNRITDLTFLEGLPLHYLILADNRITDLSPLAELTELEYLELFMNDVENLSPLTGLGNLIDLNLSRTRIEDLTPLCSMKQLKRLWISRLGRGITEDEKRMLTEALPDTEIRFTGNCTKEGWRRHPRFEKVRDSFRGGTYLPWTEEERSLNTTGGGGP